MADAAGSFVTRSFERMLKDSHGKKYTNLHQAIKAYLDKPKISQEPLVHSVEGVHPLKDDGKETAEIVVEEEQSAQKLTADSTVHPTPHELPTKASKGQVAAAAMAEAGNTLQGSEAALVLLPLRLAIETKQSKLVESALDCLHKLISYGHLEGDVGLEGGKNGELLTEVFVKVCASAENNTIDSTVLQVIKVLLTAVASSKFQVHGECLLTAIRTCYNIVLNSKSAVNQATAKATLTQMISIVFKRMESESQISSSTLIQADHLRGDSVSTHGSTSDFKVSEISSNGGSGHQEAVLTEIMDKRRDGYESSLAKEDATIIKDSSSSVTIEELQHLAGDADIKGLEAALDKAVHSEGGDKLSVGVDLESLTVCQRDALLIFRTLCKMCMKEGNDEVISKTKLLSLELLQGLLETVSPSFTVNFAFIDSVKAYLCYALLRACVSSNAAVFQLACGIFMVLLLRFRESLKAEIGVFFPLIILRSLEGSDSPLHQRTTVLRMLEKVSADSQMLADLFVNYDCDLEATNIFERMVSSLSRMAQGTLNADPNTVAAGQNASLKASSLQCLVTVLRSLANWTKLHHESKHFSVLNYDWVKGVPTENGEMENKEEIEETSQADQFEKAKAHKSTMEAAILEFNRKAGKGIEFLVANKLVPREPAAIAHLLRTTPGLNKSMIGDYLGQHEEFQVAVMHAYVDDMNFKNMKFDQAIREFLKGFRLPGEAQKIDRIMEKFAERYCRDNPSLFRNADTAYVLAYAVIMLNTDAHNPMVWPKMSKADFVRINSGDGPVESTPQELLEEIYDSIVQDEIKMKDSQDSNKRDRQKVDAEEKGHLISILNLGVPKQKAAADSKRENEEIVQRTQALFKKGGVKRGVFHTAKHAELARPMLEAIGWPLLAAFSVTMEDSDNKPRVILCMEGFRLGIHLTKMLGMDTMRYAFLTSLVRFTFLHAPKEMRSKNVEALKTLLAMSENEPDALQDTWNAVLECISRLEYITSSPAILATLMQGSNQISRDALAQSLNDLTGKSTEQVFVNSVKLPSDMIVEFFTALCGVSAEELKQVPPRVFSLQKLVEISYYNMARIRMVWARIWLVLSQHFVSAGSHQDEKIAMYAIDSLRQLGMKYLEREELTNFSFQNDILKPLVVLIRTSRSTVIRGLIVDCVVQMVKSKVGNIKSGWKSVFMVFTAAAYDESEHIADTAFENVEQVILEHFDQVAGDCFMDCLNCLIAFANNKISARTSLKSIALLRICEDRLAEGHVPGGTFKPLEDVGKGTDIEEVAEYYWFPMLAGLSELTSDPRVEVRNCALEVLFDLLKERGSKFSAPFWETVFQRVLFPIFDYVRHAGKDGEKFTSPEQWLRETCIHSLQLLCDLFSSFYKDVSFLLPSLLGLLLDCATRPDQTLASIAIGALVRLTEVGGHQFHEQDWTTLLESIRDACYTTQPLELLNSDSNMVFGLDYGSASKKYGNSMHLQNFRGDQTPSGMTPELGSSDGEALEMHDNGQRLIGTQTSLVNGDQPRPSRKLSLVAVDADVQESGELEIGVSSIPPESPAAEGKTVSPGLFGSQTLGRKIMGNMMDTLLLRNLTHKSKNRSSDVPSPSPSQVSSKISIFFRW
ncbi:hypothetical protein O6H91_18G031300 [Diphasiastrum complanatum]|uniref:Uncharacterized protein n=2 Tax=Diphasiastrum complanatum TaxID=34168 RepID=A0ACC2B0R5_DIPCM|nr:hypothetical protein O6H91_18G031300 [Diphasiastrum complanatum]